MRWIYDAYGNADLDEVAFAEKCISAILENVDLSPAPRAATTSRCDFWGVWKGSSTRWPSNMAMRERASPSDTPALTAHL